MAEALRPAYLPASSCRAWAWRAPLTPSAQTWVEWAGPGKGRAGSAVGRELGLGRVEPVDLLAQGRLLGSLGRVSSCARPSGPAGELNLLQEALYLLSLAPTSLPLFPLLGGEGGGRGTVRAQSG